MILDTFSVSTMFVYVAFLLWTCLRWLRIPEKSIEKIDVNNIKVAVIVPARNEAKNIVEFLESITKQNYPRENFRIIICDDHSLDNTISVVEEYIASKNLTNAICLKSPLESKKNAISFAIENSDSELIITTDADTCMGEEWISSIVREYVSTGNFLICGPVKLGGLRRGYLERLQSIEFAGLNVIGAAALESGLPMFCNGANLAFSRKIFKEVNGYSHSKSSSGDDTQLLLKIHKIYPGKISFLKDIRAMVTANIVVGTTELWQQRKRWVSKVPFTLSHFTVFIAIIAWLVNFLLLMQLFRSIAGHSFMLLILMLIVKIFSEIVLLQSTRKFFSTKVPLWMIITAQPIYCLYTVFVGVLGPINKFGWKGRRSR